jgi:hypothetical protein
MRPALIATVSALAILAAVSIASAGDNKNTKDPSGQTTNPAAPYGGLTPKEHVDIPYQPCREALGWVNGRLRCDNRY